MATEPRTEDRIRRALAAIAKLEQNERVRTEPIAIIGMACRFPGASTPEAFSELLAEGKDAIRPVPEERWDTKLLYDPDPDAPGKTYLRSGGFLDKVDEFDADFFGISPREAESIDPQHRLLLEVAWEALEDAGIPDLSGKSAGVFAGICLNDYGGLRLNAQDRAAITPYDGPGNAFCFAPGRLSYFLGAQGPSLAIDTACSSSLVAVHLACQSLRNGESEVALAGAVQLHLSPQTSVFLARSKALAPDGRCKSFDAAADGFGRGEGCGVVVLKRLSDALASGDTVHALIRGSAVNHDGRSSGLTVPNEAAQEKLIRQALASAKVEPGAVDYLEAHGTGTSLGDPIEVAALAAVFGGARQAPLLIGSVKSNVGHLEAASGMAGLLKIVLALKAETIPAHLHFRNPNPLIPWEKIPIEVAATARPWRRGERARIAGLSSFGFSGTNAHLVVEEAPARLSKFEDGPGALSISAKSNSALRELAARYREFLLTSDAGFAAICRSAQASRPQFASKLTVRASSKAEAAAALGLFLDGGGGTESPEPVPDAVGGNAPRVKLPGHPFLRRRFWIGAAAAEQEMPSAKRQRSAGREIVFEVELGVERPAFLSQHRVRGQAILPLAGFIVLGLEAGKHILGHDRVELADLEMREAALLPASGTAIFQTLLAPNSTGDYSFSIHSSSDGGENWAPHAAGLLRAHEGIAASHKAEATEPVEASEHYRDFSARGIEYGDAFRRVESLARGAGSATAHIAGGNAVCALDAAFQSLAAAFPDLRRGETYLPSGIRRFRSRGNFNGALRCEARAEITEGPELRGSLVLFDAEGRAVAEAEGFTSRAAGAATAVPADTYIQVWEPRTRTTARRPAASWVILTGRGKLGQDLAGALRLRGELCDVRSWDTHAEIPEGSYVVHLAGIDAGEEDQQSLCEGALELFRSERIAKLWIVTEAAQPWSAVLLGLGRTIANERPETGCVCIDIESGTSAEDLAAEVTADSDEDQIAFRDGRRCVPRLQRSSTAPEERRRLTMARGGTLDDLRFEPLPRMRPAPGEVLIEVCAAGLNFKDVLYALGVVPFAGEIPFGFECSGVVRALGEGVEGLKPGDHVVSALTPGCLASHVCAPAQLVVPIPRELDFVSAAALPLAFLTARGALIEMARLAPGETVLIHAAAGGVGQAAVRIAQRAGAVIFATASRDKWDLLHSQGVAHVFDSRTVSFCDEVLAATSGAGVDVVLNSLKGEFLDAGVRALKRGGRFIEIGIVDHAPKGIDYRVLQLGELAKSSPELVRGMLEQIVHEDAGSLPVETFEFSNAFAAFRRMAQAKHQGKIVITMPPSASGTVLITGGLGAIGLQIAEWLASGGAERLILVGRNAPGESALAVIARIEAMGVAVSADACDIADEQAVAALISRTGSLNGVVHSAGVLHDGVLSRQYWPDLAEVFAPKVRGAWNLHRATLGMPLDFFVCMSSFAALYGSPGQGAYAAANCYLDALMHLRRRQGLHGLSINWGSWAGEGMAARAPQGSETFGIRPIPPARALSAFGALLRGSEAQVCCIDADWSRVASRMPRIPSFLRDRTKAPVASALEETGIETLLQAAPLARHREVLAEFLQAQLATVLRLPSDQRIDGRRGFFDYGLDSLMALELRNRLQQRVGKPLPATLLFDCGNLSGLTDYFADRVFSHVRFRPMEEPEPAEDDIEALLERELAAAESEGRHV